MHLLPPAHPGLERRLERGTAATTACQAACPTRAITFGDLTHKDSEVSKLQSDPRRYALLGELGTRPRTTYLARIRNAPENAQETGGQG